jgi:aspartyl-tRNA(Asn)/glutamyl-tRNA(Gln) amidotransferase subunit A
VGEDDFRAWTPFSYPFNLTMQPAISVPGGFTRDGLPVGVQIVGDLFRDADVLAAALAFEDAWPQHRRRPALDSVAGP